MEQFGTERKFNPNDHGTPESLKDLLRGIPSESIARKLIEHLNERGLDNAEDVAGLAEVKKELYGITSYILSQTWQHVASLEKTQEDDGSLSVLGENLGKIGEYATQVFDRERVDEDIYCSPYYASRRYRTAFAGLYKDALDSYFETSEQEEEVAESMGEPVPYESKVINRFKDVLAKHGPQGYFPDEPTPYLIRGIGTASFSTFDLQQVIIPTYMLETGYPISSEAFMQIRENSKKLLTELAAQHLQIFAELQEDLRTNDDPFMTEYAPEDFYLEGDEKDGTLTLKVREEVLLALSITRQHISDALYFNNRDAEPRIGCPAMHVRVENEGKTISLVDHAFTYTSQLFDRIVVPHLGEEGRYNEHIMELLTQPKKKN